MNTYTEFCVIRPGNDHGKWKSFVNPSISDGLVIKDRWILLRVAVSGWTNVLITQDTNISLTSVVMTQHFTASVIINPIPQASWFVWRKPKPGMFDVRLHRSRSIRRRWLEVSDHWGHILYWRHMSSWTKTTSLLQGQFCLSYGTTKS